MNNTNTTNPTDNKWVAIGPAAERLGVHPETLRRWDTAGTLVAHRTPNGQRRYLLAALDGILQGRADA